MSDIQQEDKLTQVLEAVEHPERYTDEQLQQLLSDEACADYYRLMCDAASAYADSREADEAETETSWQRLVSQRPARVPWGQAPGSNRRSQSPAGDRR